VAEVGRFSLILALGLSLYAVFASVFGKRLKNKLLVLSGERATISVAVLVATASISLIYSFFARDFSIEYVAEYSNRALSAVYTFSGWWAGNQGSMLMWVTFLAIYASIVAVQNRHKNRELMPYANAILMGISFFLIVLLVFLADPFKKLPYAPADGQGLNPMLHNPGMYLHPPSVYLGYVGFAVPFAFAMAALMTGKLSDIWIRTTRRWTLWGWFWLTVGNIVGAWWAYYTLGWGGFWGWDPVENASFMPWLVGSAYLHSVMIQEKKGMLKIWNMVLIVLTFSLTIYGTLITRSGIVNSVHTFSNSGLGPYLMFLLFVAIFGGLALITYRLPYLKSENSLDSLVSRESAFLMNNLVLVGMAFTVLFGVTFPFISEAVTGKKITVGPPWYDQMAVPLGLILLFLIGFCPLIAWRRTSLSNLQKNFLYPLVASFIGGMALVALGIKKSGALIAFVLCIFVLTTIILEFYRGARARHNMTGEDYLTALTNLIWRNKRRYGGYIIHIGLVMVFVAIAGGPFKIQKDVVLKPGQTAAIADYKVKYIRPMEYPTAEKYTLATTMNVYQAGKKLGTVTPRKELYKNQEQPWTRVSVFSNTKQDLYVILSGIDKKDRAGFKLIINPLMQWMWIGGYIIAFGALIVLWPDALEKKRLAMIYARQEVYSSEA
jgi:cytochrome c-type biogenesis protein CcmF